MKDENKWIETWLYGFNIDLRKGCMTFETGTQAMMDKAKTFPYFRNYFTETMVQDLKEDRWLVDKTVSLISSHIYVSILVGKRRYHSLYKYDQVLDIKVANFKETSNQEGFFRDMDIPYEGLTDDEKDAW